MLVSRRPVILPPKTGGLTINLVRHNVPAAYYNSEYWIWLQDMKRFFERIVTTNDTVTIYVSFERLGGENPPIAQAGPGTGYWYEILTFMLDSLTFSGSTARTSKGTMIFNTDYYKEPPSSYDQRVWKRQFFTTAVHECFHVFGFGSLWNGPFRITSVINMTGLPTWLGGGMWTTELSTLFPYNVIGQGNPTTARYTASHGLNAYRSEMIGQSGASSIPIETYDMSRYTTIYKAGGTALAHWRSTDQSPWWAYNSGVRNAKGQDMNDELMTTWSSREGSVRRWVSRFSVASLRDVGWSVNLTPLEIELDDWRTIGYVP